MAEGKTWEEIRAEGEAMSDEEKQKAAKEMDKSSWNTEVREADNKQATENANKQTGSGR